jgi:hypothetical protein
MTPVSMPPQPLLTERPYEEDCLPKAVEDLQQRLGKTQEAGELKKFGDDTPETSRVVSPLKAMVAESLTVQRLINRMGTQEIMARKWRLHLSRY